MPHRAGEELVEQNFRNDQAFIDYLDKNNIPYIDTLVKHADHFRGMKISYKEYLSKYYVAATAAAVFGHYNAPGNHFFAHAIKNEMVEWLDPKPQAYQP
jgi:hypothetical protein